jgi:hypothetical protein
MGEGWNVWMMTAIHPRYTRPTKARRSRRNVAAYLSNLSISASTAASLGAEVCPVRGSELMFAAQETG